jgi:hypothetical protein
MYVFAMCACTKQIADICKGACVGMSQQKLSSIASREDFLPCGVEAVAAGEIIATERPVPWNEQLTVPVYVGEQLSRLLTATS